MMTVLSSLSYIMSIFEWSALLLFPLILLGYMNANRFKKTIIIAVIMSTISLLLHTTSLSLGMIVSIQMILFILFIFIIFQTNIMELFVISSIGYGFYILIQLVFIESFTILSSYEYFEILLSSSYLSIGIQLMTVAICGSLGFFIWKNKYFLAELREHLHSKHIPTKIKVMIFSSSLLTFGFIVLAAVAMLSQDITFKSTLVLLSIVILVLVMSFYHILYTQFQVRRLIEAKKFYLDQDEQSVNMMERLENDASSHFQAIWKLSDVGSLESIRSYMKQANLPSPSTKHFFNTNQIDSSNGIDELMRALLINKRRMAKLFQIQIDIHIDLDHPMQMTFQQIKQLSTLLNDLLFVYYEKQTSEEKIITLTIHSNGEFMEFKVECPVDINPIHVENRNLINSISSFETGYSKIVATYQPFTSTIIFSQQGG
ncbi:hypothetical protein FLK61_27990 [Paenalkalicoccus suaedae]|uniref:GHKL domain-containing protein n=1 Tax=Paenalkalicoccus suaedae TaxID=2592382 RepID=A0A859FB60_9BACI|nr:hypothetical protein [Paenalkalicoccus suaedae]QKS70593.1 hypothetical protein FLK61_27990 [Paenalkalicoccus suaedae]